MICFKGLALCFLLQTFDFCFAHLLSVVISYSKLLLHGVRTRVWQLPKSEAKNMQITPRWLGSEVDYSFWKAQIVVNIIIEFIVQAYFDHQHFIIISFNIQRCYIHKNGRDERMDGRPENIMPPTTASA